MAIYLTHKYGTRFYGPEPDLPTFDPERFTAYSSDYRTVTILWEPPVGTFDGFRLVKNFFGVPQHEDDGIVLLDDTVSDIGYDDTDVVAGQFVYYGVFLKISGTWALTGYTSCLHIADMRSALWLWERIPNHYKLLRGNQLTYQDDDNEQFKKYVGVFGWGLDRIRTGMRASWTSGDIDTTHERIVDLIIGQFGLPTYPGLAGLRRRAIARDGSALQAAKGTVEAMEAITRTASGWDVVLRKSRNLIGSYDRSRMVNPLPLPWDPSIHYAVNATVHFYEVSYKCVTPAYGWEQCPDGEGASNTWWQRMSVVEANTAAYHAASNSQHGWQGMSHTVGQADTKVQTRLARGIPRPFDAVVDTQAITVHNTHSGTLNAGARLLPVPQNVATPDPLTVITNAVPLPNLLEWSAERAYPAGSLVAWRGQVWHAIRPPRTGIAPHTSTDRWQAVNTDTRIRLCLSAYTHQPHTDATKAVAPASMYLECYDERGALITREFALTASDTRVLDTFTVFNPEDGPMHTLGGRETEYGSKTWVDRVTGLTRHSYDYGVIRPATPGARAMSTIDYGTASAAVAATFTSAVSGQVQAIILRYVSTTSYVRATRTALQTVSGATVTTLVTYATPIGDGDRLTVVVNGNNYTAKRNGVQVATTTSTFNSSSTIFGLAVET
ncbi:hypothetical protein AB0G15_05420 [Streptosporangium sp. NPDC023825]|uniref:hypothetical protein n=1 Tax=Streptosporangium sp. NPDC023825 TaxID=3154909 RepID=UPI00343A8F58